MQLIDPIWTLYHLDKLELAEKLICDLIARNPEWNEAFALRALIRAKLNRIDDANQDAAHAVSLDPDHGWCNYVLAYIMLLKDDLSRAKLHLLNALECNPEACEYFRLLTHLYIRTWELDCAHRAVLQSLLLDLKYVPALREYGLLKYYLRQNEAAENIFRFALSIYPEDDFCHQYLGWISLERNIPGLAAEHFADSLRLDPLSSDAQEGLERARKKLGTVVDRQLGSRLDRHGSNDDSQDNVVDRIMNVIRVDLQEYLQPQEYIEFESGSPFVINLHSMPNPEVSLVNRPKVEKPFFNQSCEDRVTASNTTSLSATPTPGGDQDFSTLDNELLKSIKPIDMSQFLNIKLNYHSSNPPTQVKRRSTRKMVLLAFIVFLVFALLRFFT